MNKIINGKRYNTETAKELGSDGYSNRSDLSYWYETLYQKTNGEFFLYGEGGPNSKYSISIGNNNWSRSEKIIPLSLESAQKWAEEHLSGDVYEKIFEVTEDDTKISKTIRLSQTAIDKLSLLASEKKSSLSDVIENLIINA